jgi:hypothetical protein
MILKLTLVIGGLIYIYSYLRNLYYKAKLAESKEKLANTAKEIQDQEVNVEVAKRKAEEAYERYKKLMGVNNPTNPDNGSDS